MTQLEFTLDELTEQALQVMATHGMFEGYSAYEIGIFSVYLRETLKIAYENKGLEFKDVTETRNPSDHLDASPSSRS